MFFGGLPLTRGVPNFWHFYKEKTFVLKKTKE